MADSKYNCDITNTRISTILNNVNNGKNVCILGAAGTGKSVCIDIIYNKLNESGKTVYKTSTTGISAINIKGCTLHRWAGCGLMDREVDELYTKYIKFNKKTRDRWINTDILIIDEISMMSSELLEKLDKLGRMTTTYPHLPFGGIIIIAVGDFLQLPPVKAQFVFESDLWESINWTYINFVHVFRYNDEDYYKMLMRIRIGDQTENDMAYLKSKHKEYKKMEKAGKFDSTQYTFMYSTNAKTERHNKDELNKIERNEHDYFAVDSFKPDKDFKGKISKSEMEGYSTQMDKSVPRKITLKKGALVMLRFNIDVDSGLANGSQGHIRACSHKTYVDGVWVNDKVKVKFLNGRVEYIEPVAYELYLPGKGTFYRHQMPLILAFAATIHKFQGSTLDNAIINLGKSIFEDSQAYVALSRVRQGNTLLLSNYTDTCIKVNDKALNFIKSIKCIEI